MIKTGLTLLTSMQKVVWSNEASKELPLDQVIPKNKQFIILGCPN